MKSKGILVIATIIIGSMLLVGCTSPSEPKPHPPPAGYESWDEYYEEYYKENPPAPMPEPEPLPPKTDLADAEQTYLAWALGHTDDMSYTLGELGRLLQNPRFFDDDWKASMAIYLVLIQLGYEEAQAMNPPSSMSQIHNKYVQGLSHFNTATYLLAKGIDELDVNSINQATNEMEIGTKFIREVTQLLVEFQR